MGRPKIPASERRIPMTVYLLPQVAEAVQKQADLDRRTASITAAFMIEHAIVCHIYQQGHVPADQIKHLRGQDKK